MKSQMRANAQAHSNSLNVILPLEKTYVQSRRFPVWHHTLHGASSSRNCRARAAGESFPESINEGHHQACDESSAGSSGSRAADTNACRRTLQFIEQGRLDRGAD